MNHYGLIGFPLTHSFSQRYFTDKFIREGITDCQYDLYELLDINELSAILQTPGLRGLNVTIPHKQTVFPFLHRLDTSAQRVGAVNVIKLEADGSRTGYNSDYYGFRQSLQNWFRELGLSPFEGKALVMGTGGASKAVIAALADLAIPYRLVSRQSSADTLTYTDLPAVINQYQLIINCSPVGTFPHENEAPALPYAQLTSQHLLYDLVYNPAETRFMQLGCERGAAVMNGYDMLVLQAEKAWEIWQR
ncbi:MAG: shikimate dehydrogenase [Spirosoma sp.]|nr:shikimate dehydrogenase [Spirosoma sp.]